MAGLRILHAPVNISDQAGAIVRALRRLGHEAEMWEYGRNRFGFPSDRRFERSRDQEAVWPAFLEAVERFDVLHFHYARSLFPREWWATPPFWDLPIYRMLGKKVLVTFHGSDIRISRIHQQTHPWSYFSHGNVESSDDERIEQAVDVWREYADLMIVAGLDYVDFVPDATYMPRVVDLATWPEQPAEQRERPAILHLPSHRGKKGTDVILRGLNQLEAEGLGFELNLLEDVSHDEALAAIRATDIVVDNVLTGDYETISIETMATSRVTVANVSERIREAFPDAPVVSATPDTFTDVMRGLIADVGHRRELARRGRPFVARVHDAAVVARELVGHYEAATPRRETSMPGWISQKRRGEMERLKAEMRTLRVDLARAQRRTLELERRLGGEPVEPAWRRGMQAATESAGGRLRAGLRQVLQRVRKARRRPRARR